MIYKLFTTALASDAAAQLDIREDGTLYAIWWSIAATLDASGEFIQAEVSFLTTSQFNTNDTPSVLSGVRSQAGILTSGGVQAAYNGGMQGLDVPLSAGERLYLHSTASGPATGSLSCFLYVADGRGGARPAQRRR